MEINIEYLKKSFIETFIAEGFTELEAIESWEIIYNTHNSYLSNFSLPGALSNTTDREVLDYLKTSGELNEIKEKALQRLDRLK
jgi:hypothetical protein